jgi:hypothetical protein
VIAAAAQRSLALAGIALLAGVAVFAGREVVERPSTPELGQVPAPGGGWYTALASSQGRAFARDGRTDCGHFVGARSLGVAHPALPCDAKLWIAFGNKEVLTQVIGRGPIPPDREFQLTRALARLMSLRGTHQVRWRYAR